MTRRESDSFVATGVGCLFSLLVVALFVGFAVYPPAAWAAIVVVLVVIAFSGDTRG